MNISRTDLDALNATININVERSDFQEKVTEVLTSYRKTANIPGFRKGHVPMGMIKKQYEQAVTADEVNKILREQLDTFIKEEKLNLLGNPLPKAPEQELDWSADSIDFEFELGLAPKFDVKLDILKKVIRYEIEPDAKMLTEQMDYVRKQYGKLVSQKNPAKGFEITAQFRNEALELEKMGTFTLEDIKAKKAVSALKEATSGTVVTLLGKGLFSDEAKAKQLLAVDDDQLKAISLAELTVEIKEINERIPAELNQELFDKLYAPGTVTSEADLKDKIKEGLQKQFEPQADQKLLNDITEYLVEKTKFDLPSDFLKRWMQTAGKEPMTPEAAIEEFDKSEKGIRYQLIEGKLIEEHKLDMTFDELKEFTTSLVQNQMMQYGQQADPTQIEGIVSNVLSNQEETRRISEQLMSNKMLTFFKENAPLKIKKVGFDAFIKEAYGKA
ncbi:trigger factor [Flavobacteriaceae bacterium]|nr:trigger factor [Flavobacteriaceae bacterium]MDC0874800.1 trigger factor [Flavobacteriaceae bacterium]